MARFLRSGVLLLLLAPGLSPSQTRALEPDSDRDGLSDALEQRLLDQFQPEFRVAVDDCAGKPTLFQEAVALPKARPGTGDSGTIGIYGQAFLRNASNGDHAEVELHYYHLWTRDCGAHGHPLDAEHVAVLLEGSSHDVAVAKWKAAYWYAAAHENTVCDVSQIARASTLHAEQKGALVWISPGKHASYFDEAFCGHGCGGDRCGVMTALPRGPIVNLGEPGHLMNGSEFVRSAAWPLAAKMEETNFSTEALLRAEQLPEGEVALYHAGRHPAQGVIAISATTEDAIAHSGSNATGAVSLAGGKTGGALSTAEDVTGSALGRTYRSTKHALGASAKHVGRALTPEPKPKVGSPNDSPKP